MDWDKLKVFYTVAESGSFTKAALALDSSQSAISRQISGLEDMLNTSLFYRHARGLTLTEQGETLFKTTREVFSELTLVERQIKYASDEVMGPLSIMTPVAFGNTWIVPKLYEFLEKHPSVSLTIKFCDSAIDLPMSDMDVSISDVPGDGQHVISHELINFPLRIYSSREYLLGAGVPLNVSHLDHHKLVVFGESSIQPPSDPNLLLSLGRLPGMRRVPFLSINNVYTIAKVVANGTGIAVLPRDVADLFPKLVQILPEVELPSVTLYYSYPQQLSESKVLNAFQTFISHKIQNQEAHRNKH